MKNLMNPLFKPAARLLGTGLLLAALAGCSKKEEVVSPTIANEALTTTILTLTNTANPADVVTAQWEQLLDNKGQPLPVDVSKANLALKANATYTGQLGVLDKSQSPTFDVGKEIAESRTTYHHFFYQPLPTTGAYVIPAPTGADTYPAPIPTPLPATAPLNLTVTTTDVDTNTPPLPLGLQTKFVTGAAGTGYLRVVLRHQPNTKDGTFAPGSTDLDVGFNVSIQ
ncbi:hypothetical protein [Hymenobacter sp. PAMC 26628]|uniref:hypothetical protein n=1 Tax=Hymenobacter sp. PAMC 26628 TaxID=1484118 RepID=UPI0007702239|nr:hypothetical protein [Hymenobacter sp. PAMC 26628]AMJ66646.1 hypothetical protein AXW84_15335 [Hymenobacter sp. PAMC 26628]